MGTFDGVNTYINIKFNSFLWKPCVNVMKLEVCVKYYYLYFYIGWI